MVKHRKLTRLQKKDLEISVKDRLIASLIHVISENNIKIPPKVLAVVEALYKKDNRGEEHE